MALSASEKQKRYRERRDQDPIRRSEYLMKERLKYKKVKKKSGKIKLVKDMTEREKRYARKNWRNQKKDLRTRQKLAKQMMVIETPPSSPQMNAGPSRQKIQAVKRKEKGKSQRSVEKMNYCEY
jgi:hypothetical protein